MHGCRANTPGHFWPGVHDMLSSVWLDIAFVAQGGWSGVGTGDQAQHTKDGNHGGAAVADQGQGQADNGHNADAHTNVDQHLEHQGGGHAEADHPAHIVLALNAHIDAAGNDGQLQQHDDHAADEAQLLTMEEKM